MQGNGFLIIHTGRWKNDMLCEKNVLFIGTVFRVNNLPGDWMETGFRCWCFPGSVGCFNTLSLLATKLNSGNRLWVKRAGPMWRMPLLPGASRSTCISDMKSITMIKEPHLHNKACRCDAALWSTRRHVKERQMHTLDFRERLKHIWNWYTNTLAVM